MSHPHKERSAFGNQSRDFGTLVTTYSAPAIAAEAKPTVQPPSVYRNAAAWLGAALLIFVAAALAGCGGEDNDVQGAASAATNERVVRVETLVLEPATFEDVFQITGTVDALDDATLSAQASGTVTHLASLGAYVAPGGTVAQLNPSLARSAVAQAEGQVEAAQAAFDLAEDNRRRQEPLYRDSVISAIEWENVRAEYNQARANLSQAEASLAQAQEQLRQTRVDAPFGGRVEEHFVELGEQVSPGVQIARIINTSRVKVVAGVPERYAADIQVGTPVLLDFQAYGGTPVRGSVDFVGSAINPNNRTFPIEIVLPNPDNVFKPEMIADVSVTRQIIEDALVVPRDAVMRTEDGNVAYVVSREEGATVAARRDVLLGPSFGGNVVVTNLDAGDEVVVLGQANITEGDVVQVMEQYESPDAVELADSTNFDQPSS